MLAKHSFPPLPDHAFNALIVDDEADIRELIEMTLMPMGITCATAESLPEAKARLSQQSFDFCITDMRLSEGDGLDLVEHIQKHHPSLPVAVISAHGNIDSAVTALKNGAFDFVSKPVDLGVLRNLVNAALSLARSETRESHAGPRLLGHSEAMNRVRTLSRKLARSQAPVLIAGESGTGKELAARLIHSAGPRAGKPFVAVNCGAIPEDLMESEFFGHKKGSFTGATQDRQGLFQSAHGGTLFLDEVGDLPLHMQVKLLRAIQERAVRPVGAAAEMPTDVRILSATHKDLARMVEKGTFRQDLYYRLNVIELRMPGLRERPEDIPELAAHILARLGMETGLAPARLTGKALACLQGYDFPGNIRELENILERAFTLCEDEVIDARDLQLSEQKQGVVQPDGQFSITDSPVPENLETYLEDIEREVISKALEACRYNQTAAAEKLGMSFRSMRYRVKKLGLDLR